MQRRYPIGAELSGRGVHFRVWAPARETLAVEIDGTEFPLEPDGDGYFAGVVEHARAGTLYKLGCFPDPASRFQPEGPHGPSMVIDPAYAWQHENPAIERLEIGRAHV